MLKKIFINSKKVPVPVPVRSLGEALRWVETTLVPVGHTITRVALNDRVIPDWTAESDVETGLNDATRLEVQIDSPVDLTVQTLDAMRNLASVVGSGLKPLAVDCWQARSNTKPDEIDAVSSDTDLILDLIEHVSGLVNPMDVDIAAVQGIAAMLKRASVGIAMAKANSDWKACARLLLNRLEPLLKDLVAESETLQIRILTHTNVALTGEGRR